MKYSYVFLVVLLAACTPTPQTEEEMLAGMKAKCEAYGFQPETVEMAECVQRERLAREEWQRDLLQ